MYHFHARAKGGPRTGETEKADGHPEEKDLTPSPSPEILRKRRRHRVYYFSGGGFQAPPSGEHWRFLAQLAQDLAGHRSSVTFPGSQRSVDPENDARIELIVVSYPLAPTNPASESLRILQRWLKRLMDDAVRDGETLSLMGDSSGGNIIVSLGFWAAENYKVPEHQGTQSKEDAPPGKPQSQPFPLKSLFSISGPMDLTNSSPDVPEADKLDVVLTAKLTEHVANVWCGHSSKSQGSKHQPTPLSSPEVSPLFQSDAAYERLRDHKIKIHGVYGTHDVLTPSGIDFMEKCRSKGIQGRWLLWHGQMHCFPLAGGGDRLGIREGREARKFVETVLRGDVENA
jgi:acetyl esterase/lipase